MGNVLHAKVDEKCYEEKYYTQQEERLVVRSAGRGLPELGGNRSRNGPQRLEDRMRYDGDISGHHEHRHGLSYRTSDTKYHT